MRTVAMVFQTPTMPGFMVLAVLLLRALYPSMPAQAATDVAMPHPATMRS